MLFFATYEIGWLLCKIWNKIFRLAYQFIYLNEPINGLGLPIYINVNIWVCQSICVLSRLVPKIVKSIRMNKFLWTYPVEQSATRGGAETWLQYVKTIPKGTYHSVCKGTFAKFVMELPGKFVMVAKFVKELYTPTTNNQYIVIKDMERCILVIIEFLLMELFPLQK